VDIDSKLDRILDKLGEHSETLAKYGVIHEQNTTQLRTISGAVTASGVYARGDYHPTTLSAIRIA